MDALGLLLRLDTRGKLDEFLDRLKILANCLTDQVSNPSVFALHLFSFLLKDRTVSMSFRQCGIRNGFLILQ